jgi:hypothetical protein
MEGKISEMVSRRRAVYPQDIGTADVVGTYYEAAGFTRFQAHLLSGALTSGQTAFVQLFQAKADGSGGKALTDAVTYTAPADGGYADIVAEAEVDQLDIANGFTQVTAKVGSSVNGKLGSAILLLKPDSYPAP